MRRLTRAIVAGTLLAIGLAAAVASAEEQISEAEKLLFLTDHLKNVVPPATLSYEFRRTGTAEPKIDDSVQLQVRAASDGAKVVSVAFFTRERRIELPDVARPEGNPVLLYFLERDIREMERLTGGKAGYFRKAIRLALARSATIATTTISFAGRTLTAREISLAPYVDDPLKVRIGRYATKVYVFTLSPDIPGGVYSIRTTVPSPAGGTKQAPLIEERLRLRSG